MPSYKEGDVMDYPDGSSHVLMGNKWVPMPKSYSVEPSGNDNVATTSEDADRLQQIKDTAKDVIKSGGVGLGEGAIGIAGLPADVPELAARGYDYSKRTVQGWAGKKPDEPREDQAPSFFGIPGAEGIKKGIEKHVTGPFYEPQTGLGDVAKEFGQLLPNMVGGGGALVGVPARLASYAARAGTRVAAPMAASHGMGAFMGDSPASPYAQIAASMLAPTAARKVVTPFIAKDATHVAQADLLTKHGLNVSAGRRTNNPVLNYFEDKATFPERFSEANNDKAMAAALAGAPGRSKAAIATRKELKQAHKDVLQGETPKAPIDETTQALLTLAGTAMLGAHGDPYHAAEGLIAGSLFKPVTDWGTRVAGKPLLMNPASQKYLGNQLLGKDTHNNALMLRALLDSTPQRLPPQELPPIDVQGR